MNRFPQSSIDAADRADRAAWEREMADGGLLKLAVLRAMRPRMALVIGPLTVAELEQESDMERSRR